MYERVAVYHGIASPMALCMVLCYGHEHRCPYEYACTLSERFCRSFGEASRHCGDSREPTPPVLKEPM